MTLTSLADIPAATHAERLKATVMDHAEHEFIRISGLIRTRMIRTKDDLESAIGDDRTATIMRRMPPYQRMVQHLEARHASQN